MFHTVLPAAQTRLSAGLDANVLAIKNSATILTSRISHIENRLAKSVARVNLLFRILIYGQTYSSICGLPSSGVGGRFRGRDLLRLSLSSGFLRRSAMLVLGIERDAGNPGRISILSAMTLCSSRLSEPGLFA